MGGFGLGFILISIGALALILAAVRSGSGASRPPPRRRTDRQAPPDPMLDIDLNPDVEPWTDQPPVRSRRD
ncbi:hypothetical protein CAP39_14195 [Sphingomonas sp. IBVSS1]|nr:hypothetical protein CAP39_14195 [Sphingomonas sp. IBVSS1]